MGFEGSTCKDTERNLKPSATDDEASRDARTAVDYSICHMTCKGPGSKLLSLQAFVIDVIRMKDFLGELVKLT